MVITKPTLGILTGVENLGKVINEQQQLNVKFTDFNFPLSDETGNTAFQWKGKTRTIVLQGFHDGDGFTGADANEMINSFILTIEAWVRGSSENSNEQQSTTYVSSFGVTKTVKCFDWSWARSFSDPYRINYSLLLKVV